jgi:hypothetical protein
MEKYNFLISLLESHDWYYSYADDHTYWLRGMQESGAIHDEMNRLGNTGEVLEIYYKHMPQALKDNIKTSVAIHGEPVSSTPNYNFYAKLTHHE